MKKLEIGEIYYTTLENLKNPIDKAKRLYYLNLSNNRGYVDWDILPQ